MPVAGPFYFAWVNETDSTFGVEHHVMDEYIFAARRILIEGEKPKLELVIENPRVGLLGALRKQWAWFSWDNGSEVVPLFFGRVVGIPTDLQAETINVTFLAWPSNYRKQLQRVAHSLKVSPYYDQVFTDISRRDDPMSIFESHSKLVCVDPVTHTVSASDILEAEDGNVDFTEDDHFYNSLKVSPGAVPKTAVYVDATVSWTQTARGFIEPYNISVRSMTGDAIIGDWPKPGAQIAPGLTVFESLALDTAGVDNITTRTVSSSWTNKEKIHNDGDTLSSNVSVTYPINGRLTSYTSTPGFLDPFAVDGDGDPAPFNQGASVNASYISYYAKSVQASMTLEYQAARPHTERLVFILFANVQPTTLDPNVSEDSDTIVISGADVGIPIIDLLNWTSVAGQHVDVGTVIFPDDPQLPGGRSSQICTIAGTTGDEEPTFSDVVGETTVDGTATWASLGASQPVESAPDWTGDTHIPLGTIILPRRPFFLPKFPADNVELSEGQYVRLSDGTFVAGTGGGSTVPIASLPSGITYFVATTGGVTGAKYVIPVFNETLHATTTDNEVVWTAIGAGDIPIGGVPGSITRSSYFNTDRGQRSINHLICRARARLRYASRVVSSAFQCSFLRGIDLTLRKSVTLHDPRLPGGLLLGKVTGATLEASGGSFSCTVNLSSSVGYGDVIDEFEGNPLYVGAGYVDGYQLNEDIIVVLPFLSDVGYTPIVPVPDEDGISFPLSQSMITVSSTIRSGPGWTPPPISSLAGGNLPPNQFLTVDRVLTDGTIVKKADSPPPKQDNDFWYELILKPLNGNGAFMHVYHLKCTTLALPQMIDLGSISGGSSVLSTSLVVDNDTFNAPAVTGGSRTLAPSLVTSTDVFSSPTVDNSGSYVNDETNILASTISPDPGTTWLMAVDTLISTLKAESIWSTFDLFYCLAAPSANACKYNWVDVGVGLLTTNGTINHSANQYMASNGSTGYFSTTFSVNSGNAQGGNACFGHFCLNEDTTDAISVFNASGGKHSMGMQASSTGASIANVSVSLNTSNAGSFSSLWGSTVGHFVAQQNNTASQLEFYLDGSSVGTSTKTYSVDTGTVQLFKSSGGSFTNRKTSFVHYGSKLTSAKQLALSKALYTFMTAMDVRPKAGYLGLSTGPTNVAPYKHLAMGNGNNTYVPVTVPQHGLIQGHAAAYPYAVIRVNDPNYLNLHRFEVHSGDNAPFDASTIDRMQFNLATDQLIPFGTTCDFAYSFFVENGSDYSTFFMAIGDLHDQNAGVNSGPSFSLDPTGKFYGWIWDADTNTISSSSSVVTCATGQWHHLRCNFRLDNSPNGFVHMWFDGVQIWNYTGKVGTSTRSPFWWNIALYRGGSTPDPTAVWYANIESDASGTSPLSGRISSPLPVPPLT